MKPTRIEQLDRQFPGLANRVRNWFDHGLRAEDVSRALADQYGVPVSVSTVGNFRARRWARETRIRQARRIAEGAAKDFALFLQTREGEFNLPKELGR